MRSVFSRLLLAATLSFATLSVATAQTAPAPAANPGPDRLTAATALLAVVMPPAMQARLIDQTTGAMMSSVVQGITSTPQMQAKFAQDPRLKPIFDRYLTRQQAMTRGLMEANMPGMISAMTRAYARRFTAAQMKEAGRFFATPTGQAYILEGPGVMSDPDVAAWMRTVMSAAMAKASADSATFAAELKALPPIEKPPAAK